MAEEQVGLPATAASYWGTKQVFAWPELREKRGDTGVIFEPGYAVQYADGYRSWSPKLTFEGAYSRQGQMRFGHALEALRLGLRVERTGWNGRGMYLVEATVIASEIGHSPDASMLAICMRTVQGALVPWLCSVTDMQAADWRVVNEIG